MKTCFKGIFPGLFQPIPKAEIERRSPEDFPKIREDYSPNRKFEVFPSKDLPITM